MARTAHTTRTAELRAHLQVEPHDVERAFIQMAALLGSAQLDRSPEETLEALRDCANYALRQVGAPELPNTGASTDALWQAVATENYLD